MSRVVCLIPFALLAAGCSDEPKLHRVAGTITLDGKAVEGAGVVFNPVAEDGALAAGKTDAQGRYELRTTEKEGALAGKYQVTVLLTKAEGPQKDPGVEDKRKMTYLVPKKFSSRETSGLEAEVPGKDAYDFQLTSR
jgi:hypothetical protein